MSWRGFLGVFGYSRRALGLVWTTNRALTIAFALLTLVAGVLPAAAAYIGKLIVDAVIAAAESGAPDARQLAVHYVIAEAVVIVVLAGAQRGLGVCQSLLRAQLGHRVNVLILDKALTLSLPQFEDADLYDQMTRARREASSRPLALVQKTFGVVQNLISLVSYGGLLLGFSPWAVAVLAFAAVPAFVVEARYSGEAFRLFRWRTPETRNQMYLEMLMAREDYTKEVQLFGLGPLLLGRYTDIYHRLYKEDRDLTVRRGLWGYVLGLLSTAAFYAAYAWIAVAAIAKQITLGEMTMYLLVFKQGQAAFSAILTAVGGMYEDNLYLSNLYEFLDTPSPSFEGSMTQGAKPGDGVRFEDVTYTYPGAVEPALRGVSLRVEPGQKLALVGENGSGKTTLIKLLTRLYEPQRGRILLDGTDVRQWDIGALRGRIGVILQDFARYQLQVGENIGAGDVKHFEDQARWRDAAHKGLSAPFIAKLPEGYHTQLGRWFKNGRELSLGQWQRIALSRAFMRADADILILDEPTAAMDAQAEAQIFDHFRRVTQRQMAILISHRFSTVRMADEIVVLQDGRVVEQGDHATLMEQDGLYARLFAIQAAGYQ